VEEQEYTSSLLEKNKSPAKGTAVVSSWPLFGDFQSLNFLWISRVV